MAFASFAEFIAMGGYGFYVWLSYGATVLALLALVWHGRAAGRQLQQAALQQAQRQQRWPPACDDEVSIEFAYEVS